MMTAQQEAEIVNALVGTSGYMDETVKTCYGIDTIRLEAIMEEAGAFRCAVCGWWCGEDDVAEDGDDTELACKECIG